MNKKVIAGIVVVALVVVVAVGALLSTKRAEYEEGDLVISVKKDCEDCANNVRYMTEVSEGRGIRIVAIDPVNDPKSIPTTDAANMETEGAMLYYSSDGVHVHESMVYPGNHLKNTEDAQHVIDGNYIGVLIPGKPPKGAENTEEAAE